MYFYHNLYPNLSITSAQSKSIFDFKFGGILVLHARAVAEEFARFVSKLSPSDVALVFFSTHCRIEVDGLRPKIKVNEMYFIFLRGVSTAFYTFTCPQETHSTFVWTITLRWLEQGQPKIPHGQ